MGLDCSHDCWHGAYSAFNRWRMKIAEVAGYEICSVDHGDGRGLSQTIMLEWHRYHGGQLYGEWGDDNKPGQGTPHDPLIVLFVHSDCEGVIHPTQANDLANALCDLLPKLDGDGGGHVGNYRETTLRFIQGLRRAFSDQEDVEFH